MANELTLPKSFGLGVSKVFADEEQHDELGAGVSSGFGLIGYKGKVWSTRFGGVDTPLMRDDGDGARGSIEVVLVKASPAIAKIFYKQGYVDGSNAAPDCFSSNGIAPHASVVAKVNPTCADCPMNVWGSRITEAGKPGKACGDSRRVAVVPLEDIANELLGGPMLLRVPAASLKDLKAYGDLLLSYQFPYFAVATRISFDPNEAYPKFVFKAIRPLTDEEALQIKELRDDRRITVILDEATDAGAGLANSGEVAPKVVKSSPFADDDEGEEEAAAKPAAKPLSEQAKAKAPAAKTAPAATKPAATKPAATKPVAAKPKPAPEPEPEEEAVEEAEELVDEEVEEEGEVDEGDADGSLAEFDAMLDELMS